MFALTKNPGLFCQRLRLHRTESPAAARSAMESACFAPIQGIETAVCALIRVGAGCFAGEPGTVGSAHPSIYRGVRNGGGVRPAKAGAKRVVRRVILVLHCGCGGMDVTV
ncbi:MAG: hypothetical protein HQL64_02005 [Magnetococcales bacterium]|nr:hypothetical protein [Magnetococcales bacterium]